CARRRRWVPGHAKARFPGPRYIAPAGTPQKTHRPREHRPMNMGSLLVLAGLLPWRRPIEYNLGLGRNDVDPPGSGDRREPRASSWHLWHLSELTGVRVSC